MLCSACRSKQTCLYTQKKPGKQPTKKTTERWVLEAWDLAYARIVRDTGSSFPWDYAHRALAWRALLEKQFADAAHFRVGLLDTVADLVATSLHAAGSTTDVTQSYFRRCVRSAWRRASDTNLKDAFPVYYERDIVYIIVQDRVAIVLGHRKAINGERHVEAKPVAMKESRSPSEPEALGDILDRVVPQQLEFFFH